jgi:8-oxo-dGTP pyrophosphatase MutT (NUDIX family)
MIKSNHAGDIEFPIEVVARRLACENTKFFVYFDHVLDKAGDEVQNYLVVAPKNAGENLVTGVAILPVFNEQVGLIRIYRPALRAYFWEIPHGFVDEGEAEGTTALRELLEETGVVADISSFSSLGFITPDSGIMAARVHVFLAEACKVTQQSQHELGLREFCFFPFQQFEEMIERSEIQDSFTLAAWCKYRLLQNSRPVVNSI